MPPPVRLLLVLIAAAGLSTLLSASAMAQPSHGSVSTVTGQLLTVRLDDSLSVKPGTSGRVVKERAGSGDTTQESHALVRVREVDRSFDGRWTATCRVIQQSTDIASSDRVRFESVLPRPQLSIRPIPSGAMVYLDGSEVGTAPVDVPIGIGNHKLRLDRKGYRPLTRSIRIQPGDRRVLIDTMKVSYGSLVVTSRPEGAFIRINDRLVGVTPDSTTIQTGTHDVRLDRNGFQSTRRTVTVEGKTHLDLTLQRAPRIVLAENQPDAVENPALTRTDDRVVVTYDLLEDADTYSVTLQLAPSGEDTFEPIPQAVSGAVGEEITPGEDKQIEWRPLDDVPEGFEKTGNRLRVDVDSGKRNRLYWVLGGTLAAGAAVLLAQ